jgi:hypothetical protein
VLYRRLIHASATPRRRLAHPRRCIRHRPQRGPLRRLARGPPRQPSWRTGSLPHRQLGECSAQGRSSPPRRIPDHQASDDSRHRSSRHRGSRVRNRARGTRLGRTRWTRIPPGSLWHANGWLPGSPCRDGRPGNAYRHRCRSPIYVEVGRPVLAAPHFHLQASDVPARGCGHRDRATRSRAGRATQNREARAPPEDGSTRT